MIPRSTGRAVGMDVTSFPTARPGMTGAVAAGAILAGLTLANHLEARRALASLPPAGRVAVDGVDLFYLEAGSGTPLVLLHGNGAVAADFSIAGVIEGASDRHRVLAFDRPGFGRSTRPGGVTWDAARQAALVHTAARRLGAERFILLGHSWGAMVAVECALSHPGAVLGLVLVSGYFFPTERLAAPLAGGPAVPLLGPVLRHTVLPPLLRLGWRQLTRKIFAPAPVAPGYDTLMRGVATRPSQLAAAAAEAALLPREAARLARRYCELRVPVGIVAGRNDRLISTAEQSLRLHRQLPGSMIEIVPGAGHMVHHCAPEAVLAMVGRVAAAGRDRRGAPCGSGVRSSRAAGATSTTARCNQESQ